ncbi:uncharacterized protein C1orf87 homolog [Hyla sarda]|uniref:uncharacterized protein C1orf87 homolog n=1 Tax=Hyla sarda TaxID=327740 RepID=UPI0024C4613B|nr:uncharacterized protein C1orf87 homolog [Hyla sarda]
MSHLRKPQTVRERMPETIVKIIGSKYVRFPVEKPKEFPETIKERNVSHVQEILGGIQDTESLRQSLLTRDRSSRGLLPLSEFQAVCASHGASLTLSTLTPLLEDNVFSDQGNIRWKQVVDLLETEKEKKKATEEKGRGLVDVVKAREIINKFNLIHNLCLSPEKISEALDMFHSGGYILLGPVLHYLKEL